MIDRLRSIPQHVRGRLYLVVVAAAPLAVFYGAMAENEAAMWVGFAGAVLGNGLAVANTPRKRED